MTDQIRLAAERLLFDIRDLASNSAGVAGLHRNGDIAPWSDLLEDGPYSPWLGNGMAEADAALAAQPAPPAEGEVAELVAWLRENGAMAYAIEDVAEEHRFTRAAELLSQRHPEPLPPGIVPVEYWDIDSGARIVSEPAEEGSGGCWVVLNSRHVNPCTEFSTLEAAWKALQVAHHLPLPAGEVK